MPSNRVATGTETPWWWWRLVRDNVPETLPLDQVEVKYLSDAERPYYLHQELSNVVGRLAPIIDRKDKVGALSELVDLVHLAAQLAVEFGLDPDEVEGTAEDRLERKGSYENGTFLMPSKLALEARLQEIE